ncbi:MAG: HlyD family efflux transporter periplasmic adaptor subunit [Xanthomonadales bacterium]|nr:efflux RND transporter periplasmic adaptor subunit [Gammaproteobacteria bacterium]MBT8053365.1 efflux RND transporter periplasmic adaptor subunit [Gammaproteobacteria bacterium]NND56206.1 HlyD family efflux transporter periplasmic adaptor subunit [Xanthomonadales bacterium]NNK50485.1 HlyD family efflux transporter periplasmic adaptor subunit [Xanthomonadales bacterium]
MQRVSLLLALLLAAGLADAQESRAVSALGRLEPEHGIIRVSSSSTPQAILGAVLVELHAEEGDDVKRGDLLAVTDTAAVMEALALEAEAAVLLAEREVEAARSQAMEACVRADVAANEAERRTRLQAQGVAGEEEAESARGEAEARKASCASANTSIRLSESGVEVARAHLNRVRAELQRSFVRAPFDGRVINVVARPGELITPKGILELARIDRMFAIAEVYETDIRLVRQGQRATIRSSALEKDAKGTVNFIRQKVQKQDEIGTDPAARKDARIIEVVIELDDPEPVAGLTNLQVEVVIHP